jgi:hypothetical protein
MGMLRDMRFFSLVNDLVETDNLQMLVWFTPNALFPLMTLFLLLNIDTYKPYLPLYMAGKCITLALTARFFLGSLISIGGMDSMLFSWFSVIGDLICLISSFIIKNDLKKQEKNVKRNNNIITVEMIDGNGDEK